MADDEEDITIDLKLRDYLTGSAAAAAHEMEELAKNTRQAARALLLLDKRADKAADSLMKLAAATRAARAAQTDLTPAITDQNKALGESIQATRKHSKELSKDTSKKKEATKATKMLSKSLAFMGKQTRIAGTAMFFLAKGMALIGAGAGAIQLAQQLLTVVGALSQLVAFAALAPVALGGIFAIVATGKLAFGGLAAAIKAAASGDTAALDKAFKKLPKSAKAFVKELTPALKLFKGMKEAVQGEFLKTLDKSIPSALRNLEPTIRTGMRGIAKEFGGLFNQIGAYFSTANGKRMFQRFFDSGSQIVGLFHKHIGPLLGGLGDLIEAAEPAWNRFLKAADGGLGKLTDWISKISNNGQLSDWLDNAFIVAKQLWNTLSQLSSIITGIIKAAGGAGSGANALGVFGAALGEISKYVNSFEGQKALTLFFTSVGKIATALGPILGVVVGAIAALSPSIAGVVTNLAPGFITFLTALGKALEIVAPYLPDLATAFSQLLVALAPLLPVLGQIIGFLAQDLAVVIPLITPLIALLVSAIQPLTPVFTAMSTALQIVAPYLVIFMNTLMSTLSAVGPLLEQFGPLLAQTLTEGLNQLSLILPTLVPLLNQLAGAIGTYLVQAMMELVPLIPQILQLMQQLIPIAIQLAPSLLQTAIVFAQMAAYGLPLLGFLVKLIGYFLQFEGVTVRGAQVIGSMWLSVASTVGGAVRTIIGFISNLISKAGSLASPFISAGNSIRGAFASISGAVSGAIGAIDRVVSKAKSLASIDLNPFRFMGGPVAGGQKYTVGEIGPEMYVPKTGSPQMIGVGGIESRSFPNDGFIVPSFMMGAFKSMERTMEGLSNADSAPTLSARQLAAAMAGAGGETHHNYVSVTIQGDVREGVDIERAVTRALDKAERDRKERK